MSTLMLPSSDDPDDLVDVPRARIWVGLAVGLAVVMALMLWAFLPRKKPLDGMQPVASAKPTGAPGASTPEESPTDQALGFAVPAKPPILERAPEPESASSTPDQPPSKDPTAWAAGDPVEVHERQGLNRAVIRKLAHGERVIPMEEYQNWTRVRMLGQGEGWVETRNLVFEHPPYALDPTPEEAVQTVRDFYAEVNRKDYNTAWNRLSDEWKGDLPLSEFSKGYSRTREVDLTVEETEVMSPTAVRVRLTLEADEEPQPLRWTGTYTLDYRPIEWKLTSGILEKQGTGGPVVPGL